MVKAFFLCRFLLFGHCAAFYFGRQEFGIVHSLLVHKQELLENNSLSVLHSAYSEYKHGFQADLTGEADADRYRQHIDHSPMDRFYFL